ncbi:MAG: AAA family ATPase [Thermoplasmata archaeon]
MIVLNNIKIENYRNLKNILLNDLADLNIFIGPNNCGKSNILAGIDILSQLTTNAFIDFDCNDHCNDIKRAYNKQNGRRTFQINRLECDIAPDDIHNLKERFEIHYTLDSGVINRILGRKYNTSIHHIEDRLQKAMTEPRPVSGIGDVNSVRSAPNKDIQETISRYIPLGPTVDLTIYGARGSKKAYDEHLSVFCTGDIINEIKELVTICPDSRLETYKKLSISEYISKFLQRTDEKGKLIQYIKNIVDPKIKTESSDPEKGMSLVDYEDYESLVLKHGSGIRSFICLGCDIIRAKDGSMLLIDEPELGLNPFSKQEFLKFLLEESKTKQVFIATHDPTFVNPVLWKNHKVRVFFYSPIGNNFVKIDLNQNKEDPNVFAGYLPHTASLKEVHIYVEGASDVYILQIWLERYLKERYKENRARLFNKIGIYHLGGDFWEHLLYTIPKPPYKCMVVLDGDKRDRAKEVCTKYAGAKLNTSKLVFCDIIKRNDKQLNLLTIDEVSVFDNFGNDAHPVYCLKKQCIEEYLESKEPDCKSEAYKKVSYGPHLAEGVDKVPDEFIEIFETICSKISEI